MGEETGHSHMKFFCHSCNVEFEENEQVVICPYCETGFIEHIENRGILLGDFHESEYSDAADTTLQDEAVGLDNSTQNQPAIPSIEMPVNDMPFMNDMPLLNDVQFLHGRRARRPGATRPPATQTLMDQLVWVLGAGRGAPSLVAAPGTPGYVLVGALGDYIYSGEGLDTVVTQLLGHIESGNTGAPPLPPAYISNIPKEMISAEQVEANMACSICWDEFKQDENVSKLECSHIFHEMCIGDWLKLHATCPICRRSLLPSAAAIEPTAAAAAAAIQPAAAPASSMRAELDILTLPPEPEMPRMPPFEIPLALNLDLPRLSMPDLILPPVPDIAEPAAPRTLGNPESEPDDSASNTASSSDNRARVAPAATSNQGPGLGNLWAEINSSIMSLANFDVLSGTTSGDTSGFIDFDVD